MRQVIMGLYVISIFLSTSCGSKQPKQPIEVTDAPVKQIDDKTISINDKKYTLQIYTRPDAAKPTITDIQAIKIAYNKLSKISDCLNFPPERPTREVSIFRAASVISVGFRAKDEKGNPTFHQPSCCISAPTGEILIYSRGYNFDEVEQMMKQNPITEQKMLSNKQAIELTQTFNTQDYDRNKAISAERKGVVIIVTYPYYTLPPNTLGASFAVKYYINAITGELLVSMVDAD